MPNLTKAICLHFGKSGASIRKEATRADIKPKVMVLRKVVGLFMVAVMLCTTLITVAKHRAERAAAAGLQTQEWVYDNSQPDPTDPQNYTLNTNPQSLENTCQQDENICGIIAPTDPASSPSDPKPLIDSGLEDRIEQENIDNGDVFLLPMVD